jgi:hypothetical protein
LLVRVIVRVGLKTLGEGEGHAQAPSALPAGRGCAGANLKRQRGARLAPASGLSRVPGAAAALRTRRRHGTRGLPVETNLKLELGCLG